MQIIRANPEHAAALTQIAFTAKRHWGYPELWIQRWSELLTVEPPYITAHETYAATVDGRVIGFHSLKTENAGIHLEHLWVLPEKMGQGIGRALFAHAVARVKALGHASVQIESDPNAAGFYQRMGARQVGVRVADVQGQRRELPLFVYAIDLSV